MGRGPERVGGSILSIHHPQRTETSARWRADSDHPRVLDRNPPFSRGEAEPGNVR